MASRKGAQTSQMKITMLQKPPRGGSQSITQPKQTPFLNLDPFLHWYRVKNVAKVKTNWESCQALLDNGAHINTITPNYMRNHSLEIGLITDLISTRVTCMGLGNAYTHPTRLCYCPGSSGWSPRAMMKTRQPWSSKINWSSQKESLLFWEPHY